MAACRSPKPNVGVRFPHPLPNNSYFNIKLKMASEKKYDFIIFTLGYYRSNSTLTRENIKNVQPNRSFGGYKIASYLRARGFNVKVIDFMFNFTFNEIDAILKKYCSDQTLAIGFSLMFGNLMFPQVQAMFTEYIRHIKNRSNKKIIIGGKFPEAFQNTNELLQLSDYIIINESENAVFTILSGLKNNKIDLNLKLKKTIDALTVLKNSNEDNRELVIHFTDDDEIFFNEPIIIELSRGCIFNCSFCGFAERGKSKIDFLPDANLIRDMFIRNYEQFGITKYTIVDSTFNDSTQKLKFYADIIKTLDFKIQCIGYLRIELLIRFPEQIELLKQIGFVGASFGVESLNGPTQRTIGKRFTFEQLETLFKTLKREIPDFLVAVCLIIGLPHETLEMFLDNFKKLETKSDLIDFIHVSALTLSNPSDNNFFSKSEFSEFSKNYQKFGYECDFNISSDYWSNTTNGLNRDIAVDIASQMATRIAMNPNLTAGPFSKFFEDWFKSNTENITKENYVKRYKERIIE